MRFTAIEADVRAMVTDPRWATLPLQTRANAIASRALATPDGGRWVFGAHARWYLQDPGDGRWHLSAPPRNCPARAEHYRGVLLPHLVPTGPDFAAERWSSQAFVGPDVPAALTAEIRALVRANGRRSVEEYPLTSFREVFAGDVPSTVAAIWATIMWCAYAPAFDGNEQLLSVFGEYLGRPLPGDEWVRWLPSPPLRSLVTLYGERVRSGAPRAALRLAALMADTAGIVAADARFRPRAEALIAMLEPTLHDPSLDNRTATGPLPRLATGPVVPQGPATGPFPPPPPFPSGPQHTTGGPLHTGRPQHTTGGHPHTTGRHPHTTGGPQSTTGHVQHTADHGPTGQPRQTSWPGRTGPHTGGAATGDPRDTGAWSPTGQWNGASTGTSGPASTGTSDRTPTGAPGWPGSFGDSAPPTTGSSWRPGTGTAGPPGSRTSGQPGTGTAGRPGTGTSGQPATGTAGPPGTGTSGQPGTGTAGRPGSGSSGRPGTVSSGEAGAGEGDRAARDADKALRGAWLSRVPERLARAVLAETDPGEHFRHTVGDLLEAVAFSSDPHRTAAALLAADHADAPEGLPTVAAWLDHRLRHALHVQLSAPRGEHTEPDGFEVGPRWLDAVPPTRDGAAAVLGAAYAAGLAWCRLTRTPAPERGFPGAAAIVHRLIHERDDPHLNH
ncbi:hypothetical protein ACFSKW_24415 [Nonomuraea mangrovi]|uniref:Collagen-like protein n=1 Tax=Nonomuraea mangrovi TaxID=2316207 RepID=A0ABW4T0D8_9ACTN